MLRPQGRPILIFLDKEGVLPYNNYQKIGTEELLMGGDMIAGLYRLPDETDTAGTRIVRAFVGDKPEILGFVRTHFPHWEGEIEHSLLQETPKCFLAVQDGRIVGVAAFDASARGFFGPIGVDGSCRGQGLGRALLLRTLHAMREYGYAYAVIGWVDEAAEFYRKTVGAEFIPGGEPEHSVYSNKISL